MQGQVHTKIENASNIFVPEGLVWIVGLTLEIKLRFKISPTQYAGQDLKDAITCCSAGR